MTTGVFIKKENTGPEKDKKRTGIGVSLFYILYDLSFILFQVLLPLLGRIVKCVQGQSKTYRFLKGQDALLQRIESELQQDSHQDSGIIWIHCASLGEFGIARPIIKAIKETSPCRILVTFFSPSGYEAVIKKHPDIDYVFYLPLDTPTHARQFLDTVKPQKALFMVSELWINYLKELHKQGILTYLVSALITEKSAVSRWYGSAYREQIMSFKRILTLNQNTQDLLQQLGYRNSIVTADPLFDNVHQIAQTAYSNPVIEKFVGQDDIFIAGSIDHHQDLDLTAALIDAFPEKRFLVVPHETDEKSLVKIESRLHLPHIRYSQCHDTDTLQSYRILIIDFVGALAYLYRYGKWAYVGGGFTPYLHNVLEATVYGLPVAFGPRIERKAVAQDLIEKGFGCKVATPDEIIQWFRLLCHDEENYKKQKTEALIYMGAHQNITQKILKHLDF